MTVVEYNDKLVDITEDCFVAQELIRDAINSDTYNPNTAELLYKTAVNICNDSKKSATKIKPHNDDSSLKDAVVALLETEIAYLEKF